MYVFFLMIPRPPRSTRTDTRFPYTTLFRSEDSGKIGFAPLTSMFLYGDVNRHAFDDFREAVHDSDGLKMITGAGEHLWRPITNPATLGISWFGDLNPQGRSEEHTSELQSLMRISYAVFCLKKKITIIQHSSIYTNSVIL